MNFLRKKWPMVAAGVGVLLIAVALMFGGDPKGDGEPEQLLTPREMDTLQQTARVLREGRASDASSLYAGVLATSELSARDFDRLLKALLVGQQKRGFTRPGIELYGRILKDMVDKDRVIPSFRSHSRRLRHQALTLAPPPDLYWPATQDLMESQQILESVPGILADVVDYDILFGDALDGDDDEQPNWRRAVDHVRRLLETQRLDPSPRVQERFHALRSLARIHGQSTLESARLLFRDILGRLGDGSDQDKADFNAWYLRAMKGSPVAASSATELSWQGPADPGEYYGLEPQAAGQIRNWLAGIVRYYRPNRSLDRGASRMRLALNGADPGYHFLVRLDLAAALQEEANRLEGLLRDDARTVTENRTRQLYDIGWSATRIADRSELAHIVGELSEYAGAPQVLALRDLLQGAQHLLDGEVDEGLRLMESALPLASPELEMRERELWAEAISSRRLPVLGPEEFGPMLLTRGLLWDDLREIDRLEQVVERVRAEQAAPRDLYYLRYLEALLRYRRNDVDGLADLMRSLLDQQEPVGVNRGDVAALTFAVDRRVEDWIQIRELRAEAQALLPRVIRDGADDSDSALLASSKDWQIQMDASGGDYLFTPEGREELRHIKEVMVTDAGLDHALSERWLELKDDLLVLTRRARERGDVERAREVLGLAKSLVRSRPQYRLEEARILEIEATRVPLADEDARLAAWNLTGDALLDAGSAEFFGDPELTFEAAEAFIKGREFMRARTALHEYVATRKSGDETRFWKKKLDLVVIERGLGNTSRALSLIAESERISGFPLRSAPFVYQKARLLEDQQREDEALALYGELRRDSLGAASEQYLEALYRSARIHQDRWLRAIGAGRRDPGLQAEARDLWEELASKLDPETSDSRLAYALYHAADTWREAGDLDRARGYLERLESASGRLADADLTVKDRSAWQRIAEQGLHMYADTYLIEGSYDDAARAYERVIEASPSSPVIASAYFFLSECKQELDDRAEALRVLEQGRDRVRGLPVSLQKELTRQNSVEFWLTRIDQQIVFLRNGLVGKANR